MRASDPPSAAASASLLAWYDRHRRDLPWRAKPGIAADPYAVWLSEVMLQQTTVATVTPRFTAFLTRWPTVGALACAATEEVMREWAGLGYYARARNLHACAKAVVELHNGRFPATEAGLRTLPGIGAYTAAAIAAIAFDERAVVVDGNVERVVSRLHAIKTPLPAAKPLIYEAAAALTPDRRAGDFAQAMMDLGATICTPRRPACVLCPLSADCSARVAGTADTFPRKSAKRDRPFKSGAAFVVRRADGALLLRTRPPRGLLGGMTEFFGTAWEAGFDSAQALTVAPLAADYRKLAVAVEHGFTHFDLRLDVFTADVAADAITPEGGRWVTSDRLGGEAFPTLMRKVLEASERSLLKPPRQKTLYSAA